MNYNMRNSFGENHLKNEHFKTDSLIKNKIQSSYALNQSDSNRVVNNAVLQNKNLPSKFSINQSNLNKNDKFIFHKTAITNPQKTHNHNNTCSNLQSNIITNINKNNPEENCRKSIKKLSENNKANKSSNKDLNSVDFYINLDNVF